MTTRHDTPAYTLPWESEADPYYLNLGWPLFAKPDYKQAETRALLRQACDRYKPEAIFLFFSGGYDSLVTADLAYSTVLNWTAGMAARRDIPCQPPIKVIHVNTGIGIPETRNYVRSLALWEGWDFAEYQTPVKYEDIVRKYGFPGPSAHRFLYIQLKERAIDSLVREHTFRRSDWRTLIAPILQRSYAMPLTSLQYLYAALMEMYPLFMQACRSRVLFITGVRKQESARRMGHVKAFQEEGRRIWVAPLLNWTREEILDHLAFRDLPRNPVVETLHMSGECLCGCFSHKGELDEICFWYPETGQYIRELERIVQGEGFVWGWEEAPPHWWRQMRKGQEMLPGILCSGCIARHET